jgi:hypothetical protein
MSGKDERIFKDFPVCENCLEDFVFWFYKSSLGDHANIYFNRGVRIDIIALMESSDLVLPVPIYDVSGGGSRMCTLEELDSIGDNDIICDNCHIRALENTKKLIIQVARRMIVEYERELK